MVTHEYEMLPHYDLRHRKTKAKITCVRIDNVGHYKLIDDFFNICPCQSSQLPLKGCNVARIFQHDKEIRIKSRSVKLTRSFYAAEGVERLLCNHASFFAATSSL